MRHWKPTEHSYARTLMGLPWVGVNFIATGFNICMRRRKVFIHSSTLFEDPLQKWRSCLFLTGAVLSCMKNVKRKEYVMTLTSWLTKCLTTGHLVHTSVPPFSHTVGFYWFVIPIDCELLDYSMSFLSLHYRNVPWCLYSRSWIFWLSVSYFIQLGNRVVISPSSTESLFCLMVPD